MIKEGIQQGNCLITSDFNLADLEIIQSFQHYKS